MQGAGGVYTGFAWHIICVSTIYFFINQYYNGRPQSPMEVPKVPHAAAGQKTAGQIEKETLKERISIIEDEQLIKKILKSSGGLLFLCHGGAYNVKIVANYAHITNTDIVDWLSGCKYGFIPYLKNKLFNEVFNT